MHDMQLIEKNLHEM